MSGRSRQNEALLDLMTRHERAAADAGYRYVAGTDEVGRGALAGPIVAAAVVVGDFSALTGVKDSKLLTAKARQRFSEIIKTSARAWAVSELSAAEIDELGLQEANRRVLRGALDGVGNQLDLALVDGFDIGSYKVRTVKLAQGDKKSLSIAAASIIAKVYRDSIMAETMDCLHPGYGFAKHKGYGSTEHIDAIMSRGLCPEHRRSFSPCSSLVEAEGSHEEDERVPQE